MNFYIKPFSKLLALKYKPTLELSIERVKNKLLTKVTNVIQGPFTQLSTSNQCVETRGIPFTLICIS